MVITDKAVRLTNRCF